MTDYAHERKRRSNARALSSDGAAVREGEPHVVDQLIGERGEQVMAHPLWPLFRPLLHRVLHYGEARRMADDVAPLSGAETMDYIARILELDIRVEGDEHVPRDGSFILAANHPTGIADGVAVYEALRPVRPDIAIFTNRDAIRVNERLSEVLVPVEWREQHRSPSKTKETLKLSSKAFAEGKAVVIFPSGRIAYWSYGRLIEREWQSSAITLARKNRVPVLPAHVDARNSGLFYFFANWSRELRDMTVFHELLNKKGKTFRITFGPLIPPDALRGDLEDLTMELGDYCAVTLRHEPKARFVPPAGASG